MQSNRAQAFPVPQLQPEASPAQPVQDMRIFSNSRPPSPTLPAAGGAGNEEQDQGKDSDDLVSLIYPIELLIFSLVGWAWHSIPGLLGFSPVIDAAVLISVLVSSCLNLVLSFTMPKKESFLPWARGFLAHVASLWILYAHALTESISSGNLETCCQGEKKTVSYSKAQAAVFYDSLPLHQALAAVTFGVVSVTLLIALFQAKSCCGAKSSLKDWFPKETLASAVVLVVVHTAVFSMNPVTCKKFQELSGVVLSFGIVTWALMVDLGWVIRLASKATWTPFQERRMNLIWFSVENLFALLTAVVSLLLISVVGQRLPVGLLIFCCFFLAWFTLMFVSFYLGLNPAPESIVAAAGAPQASRMMGVDETMSFLLQAQQRPQTYRKKSR